MPYIRIAVRYTILLIQILPPYLQLLPVSLLYVVFTVGMEIASLNPFHNAFTSWFVNVSISPSALSAVVSLCIAIVWLYGICI